uniref:Uncharacterized protein n=1 Tax=Oryza meridionalis TaxID=40149 RepID=A0A0E0FD86_9ORYZ
MDEEVVSAGSPLKASSSPPPLSSFGIWSDQRKSPRLPWWKQQFISESEEDDDEVMPPASYVVEDSDEGEEEEDDDDEEEKVVPPPAPPQAPEEEEEARALRRSLLSLIRICYIEAIRRLPAADLRTALARGVLVGGHCYGPLHHPADNILLNSIWYAAAFPLSADDPIDVAVITANSLSRVVQRSLDGLVASLRHRRPDLSRDDALRHLRSARADLRAAVASARGFPPPPPPTESDSEAEAAAYRAAAEAAQHPKPAALAHFLATVLPAVVTDAASVLAGKASLSSSDIARLSAMLAPSPLPDEPPQPPLRERSPKIIRIINDRRNNLRGWYKILLQLANAACASMPNKPGNNMSFIPSMDHNERAEYIHINFMASPSSCQCLQAFPVCFFAEVLRPPRFKYHEAEITLCCIVQPSPNDADSCHGCLIENHRIDHPEAGMRFCGKMDANGDGYGWDWPSIADVEYRFFDPDKDVGLVEYLDGVITDIKARIRALSTRDEDDSDEDSSDDDISGYSMRFV